MTDRAGVHKGGKRPTIMTYDKKQAGSYEWNSQHHRTDYTELTMNWLTSIFLRVGGIEGI